MILIEADHLSDGLYNIKDGQIFKYKAKGGTARTYKLEYRPQGEWIDERADETDFISWHRWRCSVCGNWQTYGAPRYCPNCGAKMKGADDEDNH